MCDDRRIDVLLRAGVGTAPLLWPPGRAYNARCNGGSGPLCSWFLFTPFRPTFPGPYVAGAQQDGSVTCQCLGAGGFMRPGVPVNGDAPLCSSGVVANGICR
jgi:hypothetical protein